MCVYQTSYILFLLESFSFFLTHLFIYPPMCSSIHQPVHSYIHHIHFPSIYSCSSTHTTCIMYIFILMYMYMHMIQSNKSYLCFWYTLQLASLCQSVMDLAASNRTTSSPSAAISAVSSLAREHSQLREKLASTSEQLKEVSFASNFVAMLIQIRLLMSTWLFIYMTCT